MFHWFRRMWCRHRHHEITRFRVKLTPIGVKRRGDDMTNLQILDDGKGIRFTLSNPDHPLKEGETISVELDDPTLLTLGAAANGDPLSVDGSLPTPPKDVTGATGKMVVQRLVGGPLSEPIPAFDIVQDPNAEVGSFIIQESAIT